MTRGIQTIMGLLPSSAVDSPDNKHRRNAFLDRRDDALAARFYYLSHLRRLRYDDCITQMEREFYITGTVIYQRLQSRAEYIKELGSNNADRRALRKKFPHYCWD